MKNIVIIVGFLFPSICAASVGVPVDVGGMVLMVLIFILLVVGLPAMAAITVDKTAKNILSAVWFFLVIFPVALVSYKCSQQKYQKYQEERSAARSRGEAPENLEAFSKFCSGEKRKVFRKLKRWKGAGVLVRYAGNRYDVERLVGVGVTQNNCKDVGVDYLYRLRNEGKGKYNSRRVEGYFSCGENNLSESGNYLPKYEIVYGESEDVVSLPRPSFRANAMSKISIRILEMDSGAVLASDYFFVFGKKSGVAGCGGAYRKSADLLREVFGVPESKFMRFLKYGVNDK